MSKEKTKKPKEMDRELYETEPLRLQAELVETQEWMKSTGARVIVIFEGCDVAGKGGVIKCVTEYLNLRTAQVVALPAPSKCEESQQFFRRYIAHPPAADKIKLLDRSRYNQGGVEYVMGYCTVDRYRRFPRQHPIFERMLVRDEIILLKY